MAEDILTCVLPCAGHGTRCLPATKEIPKELLPLVDKPIVQYGVEEAVDSGMDRVVIVTSRAKDTIVDHFDRNYGLEESLRSRGKDEMLKRVEHATNLANVVSVRQKKISGLGHAVLTARDAVGDAPFAVLLPDDVIVAERPVLAQMHDVWREYGRPVVALMEVPEDQTSRYGVIRGERVRDGLYRIDDMVEKPQTDPPSNLAIIGRYLLSPSIFTALEGTGVGAGGEIQLTDAIRSEIANGGVYGLVFEGTRYDAGERLGWLVANLAFGLRHPELADDLREKIAPLIR